MIKIICVCGARPNFMKIAPLIQAFEENGGFETLLVHTGQHYDENMSKLFFDELKIPKPDINFGVGSVSQAVQTADIMKCFEPVILNFRPDYVLVVGDVNSTIACGLVTVKLGIKLIHVEAGLRSFDRTMPEEINRILTDSISDLLFVTEQSAIDNLLNEGINSDKIHFVGNVMIDTLINNLKRSKKSNILNRLGLTAKNYVLVTLHRPHNVEKISNLAEIIGALGEIQKDLKLVFPIHPRTRKNINNAKIDKQLEAMTNLVLIEPLGYLDFLWLMTNAIMVLTDSGGIQEETTILHIPCITIRENTERPITITEGTNRLVCITTEDILKNYREVRASSNEISYKIPRLWDGKAAQRIVEIIKRHHKRQF